MITRPLDVRTELQMAGTWTNISSKVRPPVTISRGRSNENSPVSPSASAFTLNNGDARFSIRNPVGPYFGLIGRNTPVRQSVPAAGTFARLEDDSSSAVTCPDSAGVSVTGSMDVRLDVRLSSWAPCVLCSKWIPGGSGNSWMLALNGNGTVTFSWSVSGSNTLSATSQLPMQLGRSMIRATLSSTTGTVQFFTAATMTGSETGLGTVTGAGSTSVHDGAADVSVGNYDHTALAATGITGHVYEFQLYNGIAGTKVAGPVFTSQTAGASSFTDAQSNTWTMRGTAEISGRDYRVHGEMASWPQQSDPSGRDVYCPVEAGGLLRRLGQGSSPLRSAMRRAWTRLTGPAAPAAYWPWEDGAGARRMASALGGKAMIIGGSPQLASSTAFACSDALPSLQGAKFYTQQVPVPGPDLVLRFLLIPAAAETGELATVSLGGSDLAFGNPANTTPLGLGLADGTLTVTFDSGPVIVGLASIALDTGTPYMVSVGVKSTGDVIMEALDETGALVTSTGSFTSPATVGHLRKLIINPAKELSGTVAGHFAIQGTWTSLTSFCDTVLPDGALTGPLAAWAGERAGQRFGRLCAEEGIASRVQGYPDVTVPMGTQGLAPLTSLLQECEDADRGMLFEPRQALALGYRTLASLCSQVPVLTLPFAETRQLAPSEDDQLTRNDVTAQQPGGSSSRQVLDDGPLSVLDPPDGAGRYDTAITVSVADGYLDDVAGWALHIGTVDEPRYPQIGGSLARKNTPAGLATTDIGGYVQVTGGPAWLPPGPVSQLAAGMSETLTAEDQAIVFNAVPESPYEVALLDDATYGRCDTDGSTVATGFSTTATSLSIATDSGEPLWSTTAADYPADIAIGGERITVTAVSGSSSPQTFTVTRSVNGVVRSHLAGEAVSLWFPPVQALT